MEAIIVIFLILLDQWSKGLAERLIGTGRSLTVIPSFFDLTCLHNKGAAWSIFSDQTWGLMVLILVSTLVLFSLLWVLRKADDLRAKLVLVLIIAGSGGNLIDRLRLGAVTDFLSFTFGTYIFPAFNLADAMITLGAALLLFFSIRDRTFLNVPFGQLAGEESKAGEEDK